MSKKKLQKKKCQKKKLQQHKKKKKGEEIKKKEWVKGEEEPTKKKKNFSKSKTQCVRFCQLHKQHDDPVLHLYGSPIPVVEESKFLRMIFDKKLSLLPHIKYLKAKCLRALNILKVLSHTSWVQTKLHFSSHGVVCSL